MTKKELEDQIKETINYMVKGTIAIRCESYVHCGAVDYESMSNTNYMLAKVIVCAALLDAAGELKPMSPEGRTNLANLRLF